MESTFNQQHSNNYRLTKRVLLSQQTIQQHKLNINDNVLIKSNQLNSIKFAIGTVWPSNHHHIKDFVSLSFDHLINAAILPGQHVSITPLPPILPTNHTGPGRGIRLPEAKEITLKQIHPTSLSEPYQQFLSSQETQLSILNPHNNKLWEAFIREVLVDRKYLAINHHISIPFANAIRIFLIQNIQPLNSKQSDQSLELFLITRQTRLKVIPSDQLPATTPYSHPNQLSYDAIGGLELQVQQIRELVELPLTRPELYSHFDLTPPKGILLYGPPGTGKTLLASIIAKSINSTLLTLSTPTISSAYHGEAEKNIYEIFQEAKAKAPSIIVIDEIDGLFPNREEGGEVDRRMVGALLTCMDGIDQKIVSPSSSIDPPRVMVVATTNRPHTLDPALRRPGRFDREIEIGIPDACGRHKILEVLLRKVPHQLTAEETKRIADKTHGFVGADLLALVREAGLRAIKRSMANSIRTEEMRLESDDIAQALLTVRPSAMRELHVETPRVTWADIGGQREVKQRLVETLSWPSKYPDTFHRLGIRPIRGILLYGPPGCSKTLIAKALASESDMNFIAIKGSDVFNKFLGESEKAIRDLFRKARAASPSIIFIDEIDSIAMARGSDQDGGGGVADRVLTSLLVEMDGIEELRGVLVLAATNRPAAIDPALMRPGRLDRIMYVGPPDLESRAEILAINFKKMAVHPDVDVQALAALTDGYTGAEMVAMCQDAAINAMHRDTHASCIEQQDFVRAMDGIKKQVTPQVLSAYHNWRQLVPVQSV